MKRSRAVRYEKEQSILIAKLFCILDLGDYSTITRSELDADKEKQQKILDLVPEIRMYFTCRNLKGICAMDECKRPYWSIITCLMRTVPVKIKSPLPIKKNWEMWAMSLEKGKIKSLVSPVCTASPFCFKSK